MYLTKIAVIDPQICGISGDMFLSSLVDCGANKDKIIKKIRLLEKQFPGATIHDIKFVQTETNGFRATAFLMELEENFSEMEAVEMLRIMTRCCETAELSQRGKRFVLESLNTLIRVESVIHNKQPKDLHLHESASIDTAVDLIGSAVALEDLNLFNDTVFYATRVSVGGGFTEFSHGKMPNPTNAVLEISKDLKIPIIGGPVSSEISTPTGVAILSGLKIRRMQFYPEMTVEKIGYGAGKKRFEKIPNILRICIGLDYKEDLISKDFVTVLETNIDDVSGEILGNLAERLSAPELGVKDFSIVNGLTKKNRPVNILKVICSEQEEKNIARIIFEETGTLGIRRVINERYTLERYSLSVPIIVNGREFMVAVKISKDDQGNIIKVKPEYEDIKKIAIESELGYKKTLDLVNNLIFQKGVIKGSNNDGYKVN
ncbi:nickel pincer cofactor biosynthesis protein LarC [Candidatus Nitrosocosmicus franklandus]|uniref:nickel pincer cofactor biosynthesis protein LarC n=1 Tax=Candidatus Nitrosocosmicus franklandianus TaxID=1798806 RepID=UPI00106AEA38|nr:nickel pincer cofactor biosynthesis protein LarC [Candidatus Nitrosocosmicus franklandus]